MPESDLDHEEWWRGAQRFLQPVWLADIRAQVQGLITGPGDHLVADRLAGSLPAGIDVPYAQVTGAPTSLPPSGAAGGVLSGTYPNPGFAASPTFTGTVTAPDFAASGLTGSVAASRYVGATASGAPVAGTFAVGDFVIAQNGHVWICTVAGTPGTWADAGAGSGMSNPMTAVGDLIVGGTVTGGVAAPTAVAKGGNNTVWGVNGSGTLGYKADPTGGGGLYSAYLCYQDQQTAGTDAPTFTSGAWRTRDVNTEIADTGNNGSVASNQITLAAGTYDVCVEAQGYSAIGRHMARLQDITHSATLLWGTSTFDAGANVITISFVIGTITLAGSTVLEVQHRCDTTQATGLGGPATNTSVPVAHETYLTVRFWKR